ncbi:hypothetical protein JW835_05715 [bacterium]|nr:hypothetical protein [bacterium]
MIPPLQLLILLRLKIPFASFALYSTSVILYTGTGTGSMSVIAFHFPGRHIYKWQQSYPGSKQDPFHVLFHGDYHLNRSSVY